MNPVKLYAITVAPLTSPATTRPFLTMELRYQAVPAAEAPAPEEEEEAAADEADEVDEAEAEEDSARTAPAAACVRRSFSLLVWARPWRVARTRVVRVGAECKSRTELCDFVFLAGTGARHLVIAGSRAAALRRAQGTCEAIRTVAGARSRRAILRPWIGSIVCAQ